MEHLYNTNYLFDYGYLYKSDYLVNRDWMVRLSKDELEHLIQDYYYKGEKK